MATVPSITALEEGGNASSQPGVLEAGPLSPLPTIHVTEAEHGQSADAANGGQSCGTSLTSTVVEPPTDGSAELPKVVDVIKPTPVAEAPDDDDKRQDAQRGKIGSIGGALVASGNAVIKVMKSPFKPRGQTTYQSATSKPRPGSQAQRPPRPPQVKT